MLNAGGARTINTSFTDNSLENRIDIFLEQFAKVIQKEVETRNLRPGFVRSMFICDLFIVLDAKTLWVIAQRQTGTPSTTYLDNRDKTFTIQQIIEAAKWDLGLQTCPHRHSPQCCQFPQSIRPCHQTCRNFLSVVSWI